ncbi:hypothetical protein [Sandaracinobacteroides saxicola]|nr:hypothetical protein [Sandaracinobacteroides saxicola]
MLKQWRSRSLWHALAWLLLVVTAMAAAGTLLFVALLAIVGSL